RSRSESPLTERRFSAASAKSNVNQNLRYGAVSRQVSPPSTCDARLTACHNGMACPSSSTMAHMFEEERWYRQRSLGSTSGRTRFIGSAGMSRGTIVRRIGPSRRGALRKTAWARRAVFLLHRQPATSFIKPVDDCFEPEVIAGRKSFDEKAVIARLEVP